MIKTYYIYLPDNMEYSHIALIRHAAATLTEDTQGRSFELLEWKLCRPDSANGDFGIFYSYNIRNKIEEKEYRDHKLDSVVGTVNSKKPTRFEVEKLGECDELRLPTGIYQDDDLLLLNSLADYLVEKQSDELHDIIFHYFYDESGLNHSYVHIYMSESKC